MTNKPIKITLIQVWRNITLVYLGAVVAFEVMFHQKSESLSKRIPYSFMNLHKIRHC